MRQWGFLRIAYSLPGWFVKQNTIPGRSVREGRDCDRKHLWANCKMAHKPVQILMALAIKLGRKRMEGGAGLLLLANMETMHVQSGYVTGQTVAFRIHCSLSPSPQEISIKYWNAMHSREKKTVWNTMKVDWKLQIKFSDCLRCCDEQGRICINHFWWSNSYCDIVS